MKKRASGKAERVIEIDLIMFIKAVVIVVMCALAVAGLVGLVRSFMRVSVFEISGDYPYEREDIINAAGIKYGSKLYGVDYETAAKNIKAKCPYIDKVEIESKFPNKIKITVESLTASWYVEIVGDYYALDANLKVLEETADNSKFIKGKIPRLVLPNVKKAVVGSVLEFGANDTEIRFANEFMEMLKMTTFTSRLTLVDIEHRFEIYIQVDGTINVYVGSSESAASKLDAVETALGDSRLENCVSAEIDVSDPSMVYVRPVYDYGTSGNGEQDNEGEAA